MDSASANYYLYVWVSQVKYPIAIIRGSRYALQVGFFPQGTPIIAILDDDMLKVFPLSATPSPSEKARH